MPLLGAFVVLMLVPDDGAQRIIAFIVDYDRVRQRRIRAGVLAGRHPMAPTISPKKSWEGFGRLGGRLGVAGWLPVTYLLDGDPWVGVAARRGHGALPRRSATCPSR